MEVKRECSVKDDTKTLCLRGRKEGLIVNRNGETITLGEKFGLAY